MKKNASLLSKVLLVLMTILLAVTICGFVTDVVKGIFAFLALWLVGSVYVSCNLPSDLD